MVEGYSTGAHFLNGTVSSVRWSAWALRSVSRSTKARSCGSKQGLEISVTFPPNYGVVRNLTGERRTSLKGGGQLCARHTERPSRHGLALGRRPHLAARAGIDAQPFSWEPCWTFPEARAARSSPRSYGARDHEASDEKPLLPALIPGIGSQPAAHAIAVPMQVAFARTLLTHDTISVDVYC